MLSGSCHGREHLVAEVLNVSRAQSKEKDGARNKELEEDFRKQGACEEGSDADGWSRLRSSLKAAGMYKANPW